MDLSVVDVSDQVLDLAAFSNRKALDLVVNHHASDEVLDLACVSASNKPLDLATINVTCQDLDLAHVDTGHVLDLAITSDANQVLDLASVNPSQKGVLDLACSNAADQVLDLATSSVTSHVLDLTCFSGSDQALDLVTVGDNNQALDLANPGGSESHIMELPSLLMATSPVDLTSPQHGKTATSQSLGTTHDLSCQGNRTTLAQSNTSPDQQRGMAAAADMSQRGGASQSHSALTHHPAVTDVHVVPSTGGLVSGGGGEDLTTTTTTSTTSTTSTIPVPEDLSGSENLQNSKAEMLESEQSSSDAFLQLLYPSSTAELTSAMSVPPVFRCRWVECSEVFSSMECLVNHVNDQHVKVEKDVEYTCRWAHCPRKGKGFNARYKMLIHVRTHTNEKPHQCPLCEKSFSRLENLKIHNRSHTGERPYICPFPGCGKAYSNSSDRFKHVRTHQTDRPYMCKVRGCNKRYTDPSSLRKHVKTYGHFTKPEPPTPKTKSEAKPDAVQTIQSVPMETKEEEAKLTIDPNNTIVALTPGLILSSGLQAQLISIQGNVLQLNMLGVVACPITAPTNVNNSPQIATDSNTATLSTQVVASSTTQSAGTQTESSVALVDTNITKSPSTANNGSSSVSLHIKCTDTSDGDIVVPMDDTCDKSTPSAPPSSVSFPNTDACQAPMCLTIDSSTHNAYVGPQESAYPLTNHNSPENKEALCLVQEPTSERDKKKPRLSTKTREQELPLDLTTGPLLSDSPPREESTGNQCSIDASNNYDTVWKIMNEANGAH